MRRFGTPFKRIDDFNFQATCFARATLRIPLVHQGCFVVEIKNGGSISRNIHHIFYRCPDFIPITRFVSKNRQLRINFQGCIFIAFIQQCANSNINQPDLRGMIKRYAALNATKPPHILILKIRSIAILVYFNGNSVLSFHQIRSHIKFTRFHASLAIPHPFAIDPHVERALNAIETQKNLPGRFPVGRQRERTAVLTRRVSLLESSIFFVGG